MSLSNCRARNNKSIVFLLNISFLLLVLIVCNNVALSSTLSTKSTQISLLAESKVEIEVYQSKSKGVTFYHTYNKSSLSYQKVKNFVDQYGGEVISIATSNNNLIEFTLESKVYRFNPDQMGSIDSIKNSLTQNSSYTKKSGAIVQLLVNQLKILMHGKTVVGVHNLEASDYQNLNHSNSALFVTNDNQFYTIANEAKVDVINLQNNAKKIIGEEKKHTFLANISLLYKSIKLEKLDNSLRFIKRYFNNSYDNSNLNIVSSWKALKQGDTIDLVATSSIPSQASIDYAVRELQKYGFNIRTKYAQIKAGTLDYSHNDSYRAFSFLQAMNDPESQAVWAIRGGSGVSRMMPFLLNYNKPSIAKPLIGYSDVTGLHNVLNNQWNMSSIHGAFASSRKKDELFEIIKLLITTENKTLNYRGIVPLNDYAKSTTLIASSLLGGNLTVMQTTLATPFQTNNNNRIIVMEDINITPHQLERVFDNIKYSNYLKGVKAVILGEFLKSHNLTRRFGSQYNFVIQRFADGLNIPVFRSNIFGHGETNVPLPLNTAATLIRKGRHFELSVNIK